MDDERLKQIKHFGEDYFEEMLERIREIRLSERRLYQKITDIYALSADYDNKSEITQHFFASVQNKLHWAITGKPAAEIVYTEADATKIYMGLKIWKRAPDGKILKSDVTPPRLVKPRRTVVKGSPPWLCHRPTTIIHTDSDFCGTDHLPESVIGVLVSSTSSSTTNTSLSSLFQMFRRASGSQKRI